MQLGDRIGGKTAVLGTFWVRFPRKNGCLCVFLGIFGCGPPKLGGFGLRSPQKTTFPGRSGIRFQQKRNILFQNNSALEVHIMQSSLRIGSPPARICKNPKTIDKTTAIHSFCCFLSQYAQRPVVRLSVEILFQHFVKNGISMIGE